ncbi:MAG: DMT family transporter [Enterobacteriaceae bacterium]|nr:DMT family transporter [Enterobacteriaceae bacterium]
MCLVILLFALFASIFSLQKISLEYSEPYFLIGFRMIISGLFLFFFESKKSNTILTIKSAHIGYFFLITIFNIYLNSISEIWSLSKMSSSKACMLYSLSPFMTVVLAFFILKEKLNLNKLFGMVFGFLGLIPMIYVRTYSEISTGEVLIFSLSEVILIFSVFFSVLGWIFLKKLINIGYSYIFANAISMFFGGFFILIHSFFVDDFWIIFPVNNIKLFVFYTVITSIISNLICYNLFGYLLKYFSTAFMMFAGLMTPFFASVFGWLFLNETITYHYIVSIILFFFGLFIIYNEEMKK